MTQGEQLEPASIAEALPHVGEQLEACRRAQGKAIQEVAEVLHLDAATVRALEMGDDNALPEAIFVRGYIQNYARFLGMEAGPFLASYNQRAPETPALKVRGPLGKVKASKSDEVMRFSQRRSSATPLLTVVSLLLVVGGLGWFWPTLSPTQIASQGEPETLAVPVALSTDVAAPDNPVPEISDPVVVMNPAETQVPQVSIVEEVAPPAPVVTPQPVVADLDRIVISSEQASWIEITDAQQQRLMYALLPAGRVRELKGEAPFKVLLGYAPGVELSINGEPVKVAPHIVKNSARFNVERP